MSIWTLVAHRAVENPFPNVPADAESFQKIVSIVLGVVGAVTVIFLIINALRFTTSLGDPTANARLRNSIIYAAVGLVIVITAEIIINFVIGRL